jgi:hypothetical protein
VKSRSFLFSLGIALSQFLPHLSSPPILSLVLAKHHASLRVARTSRPLVSSLGRLTTPAARQRHARQFRVVARPVLG